MKRFLLLYQSAAPAPAPATPEQAQAALEAWMNWIGQSGDSIVEAGRPVTYAMTAKKDGSQERETSPVRGFSILQAESPEAIAQQLKGHPHFQTPGATVAVYELRSVPGLD